MWKKIYSIFDIKISSRLERTAARTDRVAVFLVMISIFTVFALFYLIDEGINYFQL